MKLYVSNRQETLLDRLVEVLAASPADPFVPETIVVQSKGMERWLRQELAVRTGVWAHGRFPFPNAAIRQLIETVIPGQPENPLFSRELLGWRIFGLLPAMISQPAFRDVARYLENDPAGLKRWQLSRKISALFDDYLVYRPELLLEWERGREPDWQAILWRRLVEQPGSAHRASLRAAFLSRLNAPDFPAAGLPRRLALFGIPCLPPFHLEVLAAVGEHIDVHLFLLFPLQQGWAGPLTPGGSASPSPPASADPAEEEGFDFQVGNPLWTSWGRPAVDFFQLLRELKPPPTMAAEFHSPGGRTLLGCLQSDLLFNRRRIAGCRDGSPGPPARAAALLQDRSVQFHSCHSPTREIEVLHDQLLDLFERMPELEPRDILVMIPDIEGYAPHIDAVFGTVHDERKRIPYSVADRNPVLGSLYIQAFFRLLELRNSRFEATRILDLLSLPPVLRRFGLQVRDLDRILSWVKETGIRWGRDAEDRGRHGIPPFAENSWEQGIRRMLLGLAMPGHGERTFEGILPYGGIEGQSSLVLGPFLDFIRQLMDSMRQLGEPHTLAEWAELLRRLAGLFLQDEEPGQEGWEALQQQLSAWDEIQAQTGLTERLPLEIVKSHLEQELQSGEFSRDFLGGRVTFSSLIPMRSIPFRVIALLGMNHDQFPRSEHRLPFDRTAHPARPADRSLRNEHRYLFLEALLSARDCLYISYTGQNLKDAGTVPPSVLVGELLDCLQQGFSSDDRQDPADALVLRHRLQPFSTSYFSPAAGPAGLFSYSDENCSALSSRPDRPWWKMPFLSAPLPAPDDAFREVDLEALRRFFRNPAAFFFRQRLGMYLEQEQAALEDHEPLEADRLTQYGIEEELIARLQAGVPDAVAASAIQLRGVLPPAALGQACLESIEMRARTLVAELGRRTSPRHPEPADVALKVGPFTVTGRVAGIHEKELLRFRPAGAKAKDFLNAWIDTLALRCLDRAGDPQRCLLLSSEKGKLGQWTLEGVDDPRGLLEALLGTYWLGWCEPLPLFPEAGMAYAKARHQGLAAETALEDAQRAWEDEHSGLWPAECEDPYFKLAFGRVAAIGPQFEAVSQSVWLPLLRHLKSEK